MHKRGGLSTTKNTTPAPDFLLALGGLCSFAVAAASGASKGALPTRIRIAKWGENEARTQGAKFTIGQVTASRLPQEQALRGWDTVSLDYEHQSVPGHPNYKADPREFAAHGTVHVVPNDGLYYLPASYTPSGELHAPGYPDVSGMFILDPKTREVIAVHSVALCQHGDVEGAEFNEAIAASAIGQSQQDPQQALEYCRELLDLPAEATLTDITGGLEELVRQKNTPDPQAKPKPTKSTMTPEEQKAYDDRLKTLTTSVENLAASVKGLSDAQTIAAHNSLVEAEFTIATSAGKKIPDSLKGKGEDGRYTIAAATVKDVLAAIPVTESVDFRTPAHVAAGANRLNLAPEEEVRLALGVSEDVWKKGTGMIHGNGLAPGTEKKLEVAA